MLVRAGDRCACKRVTQGIPVMELFCYLDYDVLVVVWIHAWQIAQKHTHTNEYIMKLVNS